MDRKRLRIAIENENIEWQRHTLGRMMERDISREIVKKVLLTGEILEDYPEDKPYPSALFFGMIADAPLHVVAALDSIGGTCFIITVYRPDLEHFESNYKTRRPYER